MQHLPLHRQHRAALEPSHTAYNLSLGVLGTTATALVSCTVTLEGWPKLYSLTVWLHENHERSSVCNAQQLDLSKVSNKNAINILYLGPYSTLT